MDRRNRTGIAVPRNPEGMCVCVVSKWDLKELEGYLVHPFVGGWRSKKENSPGYIKYFLLQSRQSLAN